MLKITQLNKAYANGVRALNNISLDIPKGMFGLLGPNGAGKSTLMKTIVGLQRPDSGSILFQGVDIVSDTAFVKKQVGFLPQDFGVYPKINAFDLLSHVAVLKGLLRGAERKEQVLALLEKTNLYAHRHKEVHTFSGGMRQRFGIAQALLGNPQLIIVDEPTAGLDPEERNRFNNLLSEIGENIVVILSTHLVEDVRNLCTNTAIMDNGKVLAEGKTADFLTSLEGALWQKTIDKREKEHYLTQYAVISSQLNAGKVNLHVYSKTPLADGFEPIVPTLEDVYLKALKN
jgi:ABC-2 type transport system ATP-binding protein